MTVTAALPMDGAALARRLTATTAEAAADLRRRTGVAPCLATVLVGDDPASTTTTQLIDVIQELSADPAVHGILLQHPVPRHVDERAAFEAIASHKDVDGVTAASFAAMSLGLPGFVSCTPGGIVRLLEEYDVEPAGAHAVVVGRSPILGRPVGMLLLARHATVTYCHSRTPDLAARTREADVLVVAAGRPRLVGGDGVKPGAVVVDAGYHPGGVGDVDHDSVRTRARLLTPVPGGVGPMTIAVLLAQTVEAAARG